MISRAAFKNKDNSKISMAKMYPKQQTRRQSSINLKFRFVIPYFRSLMLGH
uniref:Uncharacterized protein n=1 Tax=Romanomermis culicivorax TaxID=13658 RepID=A0A915J719_ROMCU